METQPIVISCLTYKELLLYFDRSCVLGIDIQRPIMVGGQCHNPRDTWLMGCPCSIGPAAIQVSENGQKIPQAKSVEPMS
jgi:hypothetical protein